MKAKREPLFKKLDAVLASMAEDAKKREEEDKRRVEEWEKDAKKRNEEWEARFKRMDAQTAAMKEEVAGIAKSNGMFAEDVFFRSLWHQKEFAGIHFDDVSDQFGGMLKLPDGTRLRDQFDIVMTNDVSVAIVETKYRAREKDVIELAETSVEHFKILFPYYKGYKIYLGIGALAFEDKAVEKARERGIGLIKQVEDAVEDVTDWEVKAY